MAINMVHRFLNMMYFYKDCSKQQAQPSPSIFSPYQIEGMAIINKFSKTLNFVMINLLDKYNEETFLIEQVVMELIKDTYLNIMKSDILFFVIVKLI